MVGTYHLKLPSQDRDRIEILSIIRDDGATAAHKRNLEALQSHITAAGAFASGVYFPGVISQIRNLPLFLRGGMSGRQALGMYGSTFSPIPTFTGIFLTAAMREMRKSRSQDEKSGATAPSVKPKTLRGNRKPSRPTRSG